MKAINILIITSYILCVAVSIISCINVCRAKEILAPKTESTEICVQVLDKNTNQPIVNARVSVVENKAHSTTDKNGNSGNIVVPVTANESYTNALPQDYGTITIIVHANGYSPHIMLNVKVKNNQKRIGIVIRLNQIINEGDSEPTISVEQPDEKWAKRLVYLFD